LNTSSNSNKGLEIFKRFKPKSKEKFEGNRRGDKRPQFDNWAKFPNEGIAQIIEGKKGPIFKNQGHLEIEGVVKQILKGK
jgi:hypothetical protein